jgi:hypothetical protein
MNITTFLAYVRRAPFGGRLAQAQIDGMTAILKEWDKRGLMDKRWLAYILATAFHETGNRMQPVRETFATSDGQAIARLEKAWNAGKLAWVKTPYWRDGWFGRGLVQITHKANYDKFGVTKADALKLDVSVRVIFDGMVDGMFTGKKLLDYFNAKTDDPEGARKIVNGTDKKVLIASYHKNFLDALEAANETLRPVDVTVADAKADDKPAGQSGTVLTTIGGTGTVGLGVTLVTGLNNPYALGGFSLMLIALLVGFMFYTGRWQVNRGKAL